MNQQVNGNSVPKNAVNPSTIHPDIVCQQAIQSKLNLYQEKERYEGFLANYNQHVDALVNTIGIMKNRILELEANQKSENPVNKNQKKTVPVGV